MDRKSVLAGVIIFAIIAVAIWQVKRNRTLQEQARESVDLALRNIPEHVKFLIGVDKKVFARLEKVGFDGLTDAEKVFFCIWTLEGDVNNGGFDQYFFNSWSEYSIETVDAFEKIGASKTAAIIRRANSVFGSSGPAKDRQTRQKQLDSLPESAQEKLNGLDHEFYEYNEDIDKLLYEFVVKHDAKFLDV